MLSRLLVCAAVVVMHRRTQVPSVNKLELHRREKGLESNGPPDGQSCCAGLCLPGVPGNFPRGWDWQERRPPLWRVCSAQVTAWG